MLPATQAPDPVHPCPPHCAYLAIEPPAVGDGAATFVVVVVERVVAALDVVGAALDVVEEEVGLGAGAADELLPPPLLEPEPMAVVRLPDST